MITPQTEQMVVSECQRLCEAFRLRQVYLAEVVGPRRHYIAGYGHPAEDKPQHLKLSDNLIMFWHGSLPSEAQVACKRYFRRLTERMEKELAADDESR